MDLTTAALIVVLGAFALGILVGYLVPGKENKVKWYVIMVSIGALISLLFALGAYVFTESSIFFFASAKVGIITFGGSLFTFGIVTLMFVLGLCVGDIIQFHGKGFA